MLIVVQRGVSFFFAKNREYQNAEKLTFQDLAPTLPASITSPPAQSNG